MSLCSPEATVESTDASPRDTPDKLRLLAVSYSFPPAIHPRAIQVSRLLQGLDASVTVICGRQELTGSANGMDPSVAVSIEDRLERVARVPFRRSRLLGYADALGVWMCGTPLVIPDEQKHWAKRVAQQMQTWEREWNYRPDVLVTFGQPMSDHLFGLEYKRRTGIPWVAHFSDPWADNPYSHFNSLTRRLSRRMERQVIDRADGVIFTSPETIDLVMASYPPQWRTKVFHIPHAYDLSRYNPDLKPPRGAYVIRSIGSLYAQRSPQPLYEAVERIALSTPELIDGLVIELVGDVDDVTQLAAKFPRAGQIIHAVGSVPYADSIEMMQTAHCLVVIDAPADLSVFFPSKLVDYIGSKRFILALSPPGCTARIVRELGGMVADPSDTDAVTEALRSVLQRKPELPSACTSQYERGAVAAGFMRVIHTCLDRARSADVSTV